MQKYLIKGDFNIIRATHYFSEASINCQLPRSKGATVTSFRVGNERCCPQTLSVPGETVIRPQTRGKQPSLGAQIWISLADCLRGGDSTLEEQEERPKCVPEGRKDGKPRQRRTPPESHRLTQLLPISVVFYAKQSAGELC